MSKVIINGRDVQVVPLTAEELAQRLVDAEVYAAKKLEREIRKAKGNLFKRIDDLESRMDKLEKTP